jgi:FkbH-like protein
MYETEANYKIDSSHDVPRNVLEKFGELKGKVEARTVLSWSEHCTECVWPTCYTTCDLYSPREDGRCRRFIDGMVRVECPDAPNSYLLKIRFKRWGKLWSPGSVRLHSAVQAERLERRDYRLGTMLYQLPAPSRMRGALAGMRYGSKKRAASRPTESETLPTSLLLEIYNPQVCDTQLSLTLRPVGDKGMMAFQMLVELTPGFHRVRVPLNEIIQMIDVRAPFNVELTPNGVDDGTTLYFGLMEFVREVHAPEQKTGKIKCVVWDLDNTLWDGVLVEDGAHSVKLKSEMTQIIRTLDARGILHSVASKNNHDDAMQVLKQFGIAEYFLCPQISWQPKSEGIAAIARQLNIGRESLLFIDDSPFELEEVRSVYPEVRGLDVLKVRDLLKMAECQGAVTAESEERRKLYQVEAKRQVIAQGFGTDYLAFLRDCQIRLVIQPMSEENLERVHELTQRTNQMNFSGNRYHRDSLRRILATPHFETYVLSCEDRFGSYGIAGFGIVDSREPRLTDLMFSCRIQSKRMEHAFLGHIIQKYISEQGKDFFANYRKTPRNAPAGKVFTDLEMAEVGLVDGVTSLVFPAGRSIPDDGVITIALQVTAAQVV